MNKNLIDTGIVSELRVATLLKTENEYIQCPCRVIVHVMERSFYGNIISCTVSVDGGAFVVAGRAEFMEMSEILQDRYQEKTTTYLFKKYIANKD